MAYDISKETKVKNFEFHAEAILEYLKKYWDISVEPKGYAEAVKNHDEFECDKVDEKGLMDEFKGHNGGLSYSYPLPVNLQKDHVAFSDVDQGRKPIETLVGSILTYGAQYGQVVESAHPKTHKGEVMQEFIHSFSYLRKCMEGVEKSFKDGDINQAKDWFGGVSEDLRKLMVKLKAFERPVNKDEDKELDFSLSEWIAEQKAKWDYGFDI
jgi:hypothetical protein